MEKALKDTKWYENCFHKALRRLFSENTSTIPGCTKNCSLKHMHNAGEYEKLFSETYAQYRVVWIDLPDATAKKMESWGPGVIPGKWGGDVDPRGESARSREFQGGRRRRQSSSPGVIPGGMGQRRSRRRAVPFQGVPGSGVRGSIPGRRRRLDPHQWAGQQAAVV